MSKSILVVDDDWVTRSTLQEALEGEGYEVDTASDGLIAWKNLLSISPVMESFCWI